MSPLTRLMHARQITDYYERKLRMAREAEEAALAEVEAAERVALASTMPVPLVRRTSSVRPPPLPATGTLPRFKLTGFWKGVA